MPFMIAPMPCSRMPKWKLRPAWSSGPNVPGPLSIVLFDGARSALPPISSGTFAAIALSVVPDAARLATAPFSAVNVGIAESQPTGSSPRQRRANSAARSGCAAA